MVPDASSLSPERAAFFKRLAGVWDLTRYSGSRKPPKMSRKPLDLLQLYKVAQEMGGFDALSASENRSTSWSQVYKRLDNFSKTETSASYRLKRIYETMLLKYEQHYASLPSRGMVRLSVARW